MRFSSTIIIVPKRTLAFVVYMVRAPPLRLTAIDTSTHPSIQWPPSTLIVCPVIHAASSEAKKRTARAMSWACPGGAAR